MNYEEKAIPQRIRDFAKELGELCTRHELNHFAGKIDSFHGLNCVGGINFNWNSGRHGAEEAIIKLSASTTITVECPINYKDKLSNKETEAQND